MSCELYRHYDSENVLLYVGISLSSVARLNQHRRSSWFNRIARVEIQRCPTREFAGFLESLAVRDEKPLYNRLQPSFDADSPTLTYLLVQEARGEAWEKAWAQEDVSELLELCDEMESYILPSWYRRQKEGKK